MVNRYAVINEENIVENIILASNDFTLEGKLLVKVDDINCNIGNKYVDNNFIHIEPTINPPELTELELLKQRMSEQDMVLEELMFVIIPEMMGGGI